MSEVTHSILLADALRRAGLFFEHIENEGRRDGKRAGIGRRMGRTKGSFDYRIYDVPPARPDARCVALELKDTAGRLSPEQVSWAERFRERGGLTLVARGVDDALKQLRALGYAV